MRERTLYSDYRVPGRIGGSVSYDAPGCDRLSFWRRNAERERMQVQGPSLPRQALAELAGI